MNIKLITVLAGLLNSVFNKDSSKIAKTSASITIVVMIGFVLSSLFTAVECKRFDDIDDYAQCVDIHYSQLSEVISEVSL